MTCISKLGRPLFSAKNTRPLPYADQRIDASFNFVCSSRKISHQLLLGLAIYFSFRPLGFRALDAFLIHNPALSVLIRVAAEQCT